MKVLVTGASGFVGWELCSRLHKEGNEVIGALRRGTSVLPSGVERRVVGYMNGTTQWDSSIRDVAAVIHLAARTHIIDDRSADPLAEYRRVNVEGTRRLAYEAAKAGVKRFVFLSSIKVNGERTYRDSFNENDTARPEDFYGISKYEAENVLKDVCNSSNMEYVILRSPLVYGPKVKANFLKLMKIIDSGMPLPLGSVKNQRSLIYIGNLVDAIVKCIEHPAAANKTFLVSDGEDLSTPELIERLSDSMGVKSKLFNFPVSLLKIAAAVAGKSAEIERLTGNLTIDSTKIRTELDWIPPYSVSEGLKLTAQWYKNEKIV